MYLRCLASPVSIHSWEVELRWQLWLHTWPPRVQIYVCINLFPDSLAKTKLIFFLKETFTRGRRRSTFGNEGRCIYIGHISDLTKGYSQPGLAGATPGTLLSTSASFPALSLQEVHTVPVSLWHDLHLSWHLSVPGASLQVLLLWFLAEWMNKVLPYPTSKIPLLGLIMGTLQDNTLCASFTLFRPLCSCVLLMFSDLLGFDSHKILRIHYVSENCAEFQRYREAVRNSRPPGTA